MTIRKALCYRLRASLTCTAAALVAVGMTACDSLIDVENPNNVSQEDVENPTAASSVVSGALALLSRSWGGTLTTMATISDELLWIGTRDNWGSYDQGFVTNAFNEFADADEGFPLIAQTRFVADDAIRLVLGFDTDGTIIDRLDLARAYLYGGLTYMTIADRFDDFVIASNRRDAGERVGAANMSQLYVTAIGYFTSGLAVAVAESDAGLQVAFTALLASARHRMGIWGLLNPPGTTPANPLITDGQMVTDAVAALAMAPTADWKYQLTYAGSEVTNIIGDWVNERTEHMVGGVYGVPDLSDSPPKQVLIGRSALMDPIDGVEDPEIIRVIAEFTDRNFGPLTLVSVRELELIIAEDALARADLAEFQTRINNVRALDPALTPYDRNNVAHPAPQAMLEYARQANTFLQGRRLADHYRFGQQPASAPVPGQDALGRLGVWLPSSEAATTPGVFLPISVIECQSNPNIPSGCQ